MEKITPDSNPVDKMSLICACVVPVQADKYNGIVGSLVFSQQLPENCNIKQFTDLEIDTVLPVTTYENANYICQNLESERVCGTVLEAGTIYFGSIGHHHMCGVKVKTENNREVYINVWELIRIFAVENFKIVSVSANSSDQEILNFLAAVYTKQDTVGIPINFCLSTSFDCMHFSGDLSDFSFGKMYRIGHCPSKVNAINIIGETHSFGKLSGGISINGLSDRCRDWLVISGVDKEVFGLNPGVAAVQFDTLLNSNLIACRYSPRLVQLSP